MVTDSGVFPTPSPKVFSPCLVGYLVDRSIDSDRVIDRVIDRIDQGRDRLGAANIRHMFAVRVDIATAAPKPIERPAILGLADRIEIGEREPQTHGLVHPAIRTGLLNDQKGLSDQIVARESGHIQTSTKQERLGKATKRTNVVAQSKRT